MVPMPANVERPDRLQIQNVKLSPPVFFAPDRHRLTIAYQLNAPDAMQAFVTMDIFDLRGQTGFGDSLRTHRTTLVLTLHSGMD